LSEPEKIPARRRDFFRLAAGGIREEEARDRSFDAF